MNDSTTRTKKSDTRSKVNVPGPRVYTLPFQLEDRLKNAGRNIKIYSRINIKIKPGDVNTNLQHLKNKPVQDYDLICLEPVNNQVLLVNII